MTCYNQYRPPILKSGGDVDKAGPWLDHTHRIYPNDADHVIKWLAHCVQQPGRKINHALCMFGNPGIGKDTILKPVARAVGTWNFKDVSPQDILETFNGFLKAVVLRVNEARDLGEANRFSFYERMKIYTAAPPDVLPINEKYLGLQYIANVVNIIITSNYKTDGIYLPANDRRHYVAWSDSTQEGFPKEYWLDLDDWYEHGGYEHVAAYLAALDISRFDPKAPPPKTDAFHQIAAVNRAPENIELADALDEMGRPDVITIDMIIKASGSGEIGGWIMMPKNKRAIPHRLEECGYVTVHNKTRKDGSWKIDGKAKMIYGRGVLSPTERLRAVEGFAAGAS
jgi:hypothetical protein